MGQYPIHGFHRHRFAGSGIPFLHDHLAPFIELFVDIDLYRTDIGAGTAKRRCEGQVGVFGPVEIGGQNGADRAGYCRMIAVATAAPIDGTGIETGGTADTFQRVAEILAS
jgi:hypothetical protein